MKRKKLILNALMLTFSTMTLGFISMSFRVYLSNKIGAEGMGLFQLIMSINVFASTLAISGIRVTITRLIAEEIGKGNYSKSRNILSQGIKYALFFGFLTAILLYNSAEFIGLNWIKDERSIISLKILSCGIPFVGICCCYNGYFYGVRKVLKSVTSDIIESMTMMGVIVLFLLTYGHRDLEITCAAITCGMSISVLISTLYSYILYLFDKKGHKENFLHKSSKCSFGEVASVSFPIGCSAYIQTGLRTLEDILIPNSLRMFGSSSASSLYIFGMIKGMVLPILTFPSIFLASFSTLIIPEIAEANALNRKNLVNFIISKIMKFTLLISLFATGLFMIYSKELGLFLYNSLEVGIFMRILAPLIPMMFLDRIVDGSLNALDQQMSTLRYNLIDMCVRIFIILFIIPKKGIDGFILVIFVSTILNSSLSINKLLKVTNLDFKVIDWVLKPLLCVVSSCYITKFIFSCLSFTSLIAQIILSLCLYSILLMLIGCIRKRDIRWFIDAFRHEVKMVNYKDISIYKFF